MMCCGWEGSVGLETNHVLLKGEMKYVASHDVVIFLCKPL